MKTNRTVPSAVGRHFALRLTTTRVALLIFAIASACLSWPVSAAEPRAETPVNAPPGIDPQLMERWDRAYRDGRRPPWDTGRPSSELRRMVESNTLRPCRAVELGCGTGANAVYLASKGFEVTALDVAPTALKLARERAEKAGVKVNWVHANVLAPPALGTFDLIFDRGCYHGVRRRNAAGYVATLKKLCRPGGRVLILAGNANEQGRRYGPPRVDETELVADFAKDFDFVELREIRFDTAEGDAQGALAWSVLLRRKPSGDEASQGGQQMRSR